MRDVAIIGVGATAFRAVTPDLSWKELMFEAAQKAYHDAGVDPRKEIDSFITCAEDFWEGFSIFDEFVPDQIGAALRPVHTVCGDGLQGLANAFMQIQTGQFDVVAVEAHSKISDLLTYGDVARLALDPLYEAPLVEHVDALAGLEMRRFLEATATTEAQCAAVVAANKRKALANPLAAFEADLEVEDVLNSEYLFDPLKRLDVAPRADGAIVLVLAAGEVARRLTGEPVYLRGVGWCSESPWAVAREGEAGYARRAAQMAYRMAKIQDPRLELDLVEVDDKYSYKQLQHLEALGLARSGEAGFLAQEGALERDGELPTNLSGGSLGCGDLIEAAGLQRALEVVLQLRGRAGARQVEGARLGLAQSWRGLPHGTGAVAVFERGER